MSEKTDRTLMQLQELDEMQDLEKKWKDLNARRLSRAILACNNWRRRAEEAEALNDTYIKIIASWRERAADAEKQLQSL